jgi:hypothetical protein
LPKANRGGGRHPGRPAPVANTSNTCSKLGMMLSVAAATSRQPPIGPRRVARVAPRQ